LVRIVIADDHADIRRRIRALLESHNWIVCGEAANGREALERVRQLRPDVVLLDLTMPDVDGLQATRRIVDEAPQTAVLILTMHQSEELADEVIRAGASAIIDKSRVYEKLIGAITSLHAQMHLAGKLIARAPHIGAFFQSTEEAYRILGPFIQEGLQDGEKAIHIVGRRQQEFHIHSLKNSGVDAAKAQSKEQLDIVAWEETYLHDGHFDARVMLDIVPELLLGGPRNGFPKCRVVAWMGWAADPENGSEQLVEYEARLNFILPQFDDAVICVYDLSKFSGGVITDLIRSHPAVIIGGVFNENPFYVPPDRMLDELSRRAE